MGKLTGELLRQERHESGLPCIHFVLECLDIESVFQLCLFLYAGIGGSPKFSFVILYLFSSFCSFPHLFVLLTITIFLYFASRIWHEYSISPCVALMTAPRFAFPSDLFIQVWYPQPVLLSFFWQVAFHRLSPFFVLRLFPLPSFCLFFFIYPTPLTLPLSLYDSLSISCSFLFLSSLPREGVIVEAKGLLPSDNWLALVVR